MCISFAYLDFLSRIHILNIYDIGVCTVEEFKNVYEHRNETAENKLKVLYSNATFAKQNIKPVEYLTNISNSDKIGSNKYHNETSHTEQEPKSEEQKIQYTVDIVDITKENKPDVSYTSPEKMENM